MKESEKKYLLGRLEMVRRDCVTYIEAKYTHPGKELDIKEKIKLICGGSVSPKNPDSWGYWTKVMDAFDFSKYESPKRVDKNMIELKMHELMKIINAARDQVMLGDVVDGLACLRDVEERIAVLLD